MWWGWFGGWDGHWTIFNLLIFYRARVWQLIFSYFQSVMKDQVFLPSCWPCCHVWWLQSPCLSRSSLLLKWSRYNLYKSKYCNGVASGCLFWYYISNKNLLPWETFYKTWPNTKIKIKNDYLNKHPLPRKMLMVGCWWC